jgi:hypothetical protein
VANVAAPIKNSIPSEYQDQRTFERTSVGCKISGLPYNYPLNQDKACEACKGLQAEMNLAEDCRRHNEKYETYLIHQKNKLETKYYRTLFELPDWTVSAWIKASCRIGKIFAIICGNAESILKNSTGFQKMDPEYVRTYIERNGRALRSAPG